MWILFGFNFIAGKQEGRQNFQGILRRQKVHQALCTLQPDFQSFRSHLLHEH